jgi:RNA polymerase sigma-19 factor, ECF subfamily
MATVSEDALVDASICVHAIACYERELLRYLIRRLPNRQDVDDVRQEIYVRLLGARNGSGRRPVRQPLAYLFGVAAHAVADFWHAIERDRLHVESHPVEQWSDDPAAAKPDELADQLNLQQQVEQALDRLPQTHAAVLVLHKRDGLSYEEVAKELDLSVHTVAKYVTQAKGQMRAMPWDA